MNHFKDVFNLRIVLAIFLVFFSVYLSYYPVFHGAAWLGHDIGAHLNRVYSTLNNLNQGQFPPYFDVDYQGYPGYSWNLFYPPLYNFIASPIFFVTESYNLTVKLVSLIIWLIASLSAYYLFSQKNKNKQKAILFALCFSCSLYLVDNIFVRAAYPESFALAFYPIFMAGLFTADDGKSFKLLTLSNALVILSNIPASICLLFFTVLFFAFHHQQLERLKIFVRSYLVALLMCAWCLVPLVYSLYDTSLFISSTPTHRINHFAEMMTLSIDLYHFISGNVKLQPDMPYQGMILGIGYSLFILFIYNQLMNKQLTSRNSGIIFILILVITGTINYAFLPDFILDVLAKVQFLWRLTPFVVLLMLWEINKNVTIKPAIILVVLVFTSLQATGITLMKARSQDINNSLVQESLYSDYVMNEVIKTPITVKNQLTCRDGEREFAVTYQRMINSNGLPKFLFEMPSKGSCIIPFLAYNPLKLTGVDNFERAGFFRTTLKAGHHDISIEKTTTFRYAFNISILLTLITSLIFFKFSLFKKK